MPLRVHLITKQIQQLAGCCLPDKAHKRESHVVEIIKIETCAFVTRHFVENIHLQNHQNFNIHEN